MTLAEHVARIAAKQADRTDRDLLTSAATALADKDDRIQTQLGAIQRWRTRAGELEGDLAAARAQIAQLEACNARWAELHPDEAVAAE